MTRIWRARLRALCLATWRYARSAPGTYVWLAALLVTTILLNHLNPDVRETYLVRRSTNLHELEHRPVKVLIDSAFYIDGSSWWPYLVLYTIFHAPAERWLGTCKWLLVAAIAHVGATYISEGDLNWLINHALAPASERRVLDVGVSYALAGIQAVLVYKLVPRWRLPYAAVLMAYYSAPLFSSQRTFTNIGHFSAALLGFACYPLAVYTISGGRLRRTDYRLADPGEWIRILIKPPRRTSGPRDRRRPGRPGGP